MKKIKKMPIIIAMFIITMICFAPLVYARFTRQYNPEVSPFAVTIASQDNIMVSTDGRIGTFKDALKLSELVSNTDVTLTPLTGKVAPTVDGEYVHFDLKDSLGNDATSGFYAFDLYFIGSSDMNLYLAGNTTGTVATFDDTTANESFTSEQRARLLANLRIGFLTYSTTYQPSGTGIEPVYSDSPIATNIYATSVISNANYTTFSKLGYSNNPNDTILATTTKEEITKIRVVIWLEEDGLGELDAICKLTLSVRFQAVPIEVNA